MEGQDGRSGIKRLPRGNLIRESRDRLPIPRLQPQKLGISTRPHDVPVSIMRRGSRAGYSSTLGASSSACSAPRSLSSLKQCCLLQDHTHKI
ncbi:hypothetical protein M3J09_005143 [Ascochyta lentis]